MSPVTVMPALDMFVSEIETLIAVEPNAHRVTREVQSRLANLIASPGLLAPEHRQPWPDRYRTHLLAVAPSRRFSVVAMVWLPGQVTPIHDHICWCVVGVLQGAEEEQRYHLREDVSGGRWLVPWGRQHLAPGDTCALVPPDENIHRVRNAGDCLAISIHVYGEDIAAYGSSINQRFDDLPIRPRDWSGRSVAWRRAIA